MKLKSFIYVKIISWLVGNFESLSLLSELCGFVAARCSGQCVCATLLY